MNYLEIVKEVWLLSGMQGSGPDTIEDAEGVEKIIVRFCKDAYIDIQNLREEFSFLGAKSSFNTIIGQDEYDYLDIFSTSAPDFKKYNTDSFIITNDSGKKTYLKEISREEMEAYSMNSTNTKIPSLFAIDEIDNSLILFAIPDMIYNISFRYWKNPEILSSGTQIPLLPLSFHLLIVYKALEKLAVYLSSPELYTEYSTEAAKMQGQLMRLNVPKMTLKASPMV